MKIPLTVGTAVYYPKTYRVDNSGITRFHHFTYDHNCTGVITTMHTVLELSKEQYDCCQISLLYPQPYFTVEDFATGIVLGRFSESSLISMEDHAEINKHHSLN